eukprot:915958-Prorocentrum_minimum.AAC.2
MITDFVKLYTRKLNEYVDLLSHPSTNKLDVVVLEKKQPTFDKKKKIYKDGIHIIMPNIIFESHTQLLIREKCLDEARNIFAPMNTSNAIEDIFDKMVFTSGLMMFGSKKANCKYYYDPILAFSIIEPTTNNAPFGLRKTNEITYDIPSIVKLLSIIRNKNTLTPIRQEKLDEIEQFKASRVNSSKKSIEKTDDATQKRIQDLIPTSTSTSTVNIKDLRKAVMMLDKQRADDYALWRNVIYAIGNSCDFSKEGLEIAHEFSKQCQSKYGGVDDMYLSNNKKGKSSLTFGSIVHWLKEDGKDTKWLTKQEKVVTKKKNIDENEDKKFSDEEDDEKNLLNFTEYGLAKIMYKKFKNKYVAIPTIKDGWYWYEFKGNLWCECEQGASLLEHMNHYLYQVICDKIAVFAKRCAIEKTDDKRNYLRNIIEQLTKLSKSVRGVTKKGLILKECALLFRKSVKEFYDKLDTKKNLIAFNNGVFDLDKNEFRNTKPEDMLSMSTNYDYTNVVDESIQNEIMGFFDEICANIEERDYLLSV